ncbi:hypothetical protein PVAP13_1NG452919 [Panicum virgatum]|uniref:Uncharacterized protein n=1 Tax=Panicum virgatum TaxID=38727 RepID=A0A8T0WVW3_PANVG|nr:hypothetical protein PVAP13_1NG452919 [Panicum virgatum]
MKSGGEFSQFFSCSPFFLSPAGSNRARRPPRPISLPRLHVANPSSPPPPPGRGSPPRAPAAPLPPELYVPAACSGRRILGALLWPLPQPARPRRRASSECSRRGRGRGLSREPRPPPSPCVVVEGIFPFLLPLLRIGHVRLFGIWTIEHSSKSRVPVLDAIALGILIHGHVEHVGDFYFH